MTREQQVRLRKQTEYTILDLGKAAGKGKMYQPSMPTNCAQPVS